MKRTKQILSAVFLAAVVGMVPASSRAQAPAKAVYFNDFETIGEGDVPGDMLILSGMFTVKKIDGNSALDLPGDPLDGYGVMFGPTDSLAASARIFGTSTGKRCPEFGLGIGDAAGYRLSVMPGANEVQLMKGDDVVAKAPFQWKTGTWTQLKVQTRKLADGTEQVEGKVWTAGDKEPKAWAVTIKITEPVSGRASVWGAPYSSTPIRFDDLAVTTPEE